MLVHAYDFGAGRFGGYARYGRVPAEWVVRIPDALSTFEAMAIGTAGYTAAMALLAIELNGEAAVDYQPSGIGLHHRGPAAIDRADHTGHAMMRLFKVR